MAKAIVLAGLGFGDEGKGTMTEYLAAREKVSLVVRYNGGCQTAHNVVTSDGKHHTFAQFGSATLRGVPTFLSKYMLVEPLALMGEAAHLHQLGIMDPLGMLTIDERALITTPYHRAINQLRELKRWKFKRHGSCGVGIGETVAYAELKNYGEEVPVMGDVNSVERLIPKLVNLQKYAKQVAKELEVPADLETMKTLGMLEMSPGPLANQYHELWRCVRFSDFLAKMNNSDNTILFEGAQGVLLDKMYGFFPHVTRTSTTFENACSILREVGFKGERKFVGVVRAYCTRHGDGPMPSEISKLIPDLHNKLDIYQGCFRVGTFDFLLLKYASEVIGGVDELMVTHMDTLKANPDLAAGCVGYNGARENPQFFHFDEYGTARGIKVDRSPSLEKQAELTKALYSCTSLNAHGFSGMTLLNRLKEEGFNVTTISSGPTLESKKEAWG